MIKKDSFIVYRSFYIGLKALTNKDRLQLYDAIFEYGYVPYDKTTATSEPQEVY